MLSFLSLKKVVIHIVKNYNNLQLHSLLSMKNHLHHLKKVLLQDNAVVKGIKQLESNGCSKLKRMLKVRWRDTK
ncbi:hypothetical protein ACOSP7_031595 [Xanthoceras sorbifolium]